MAQTPQYAHYASGLLTLAVRVPRRYSFLVKAFAHWLTQHPDQSAVLGVEESLELLYSQQERLRTTSPARRTQSAEAFTKAIALLIKAS